MEGVAGGLRMGTESTCKHRKLDGSIDTIPLTHASPSGRGRSGESLTESAGTARMVAVFISAEAGLADGDCKVLNSRCHFLSRTLSADMR